MVAGDFADMVFQFTPLREGRPCSCVLPCKERNFNSRPSARGDIVSPRYMRLDYISIHAPPRGATVTVLFSSVGWLFQFTPLREGRRNLSQEGSAWVAISIHAPPRGATL